MRIITCLLLFSVVILGLTFSLLNADPVSINYYLGNSKLPLSFLLFLAFTSGALLGLLVGLCMYLRALRESFRLAHRLKVSEKEVANLRMVPLRENK